MSLIIENLKVVENNICVDIGDEENSGANGKLTVACNIDGRKIHHEKIVALVYPPKSVILDDACMNGKGVIVSVTLSNHDGSNTRKRFLQL